MPTLFSRSLPCSRAAIHGTSADASAGRRVAGRILLLLLVLPLLLAAAALSCGGDGCSCGPAGKEEPRAPLLSRVSMDVLGILLVPRTDRLATQLRGLYDRFLSQFPDLAKMAGDIRSQTGIDLLRPETIGEIGLDPAGELLLAVHPDWVLFGLSLSSSERFERYLRDRFARELPGMLEFRAAKAGERDAWLVAPRQPAGAPPVLGYVTLGDQMLIVPGQGPQQQPVDPLVRLAGALALPAERSLPVAAPGFADLLAAAGEEPGAVAWLNTVPLARVLAEQARGRGAADEARFHDGLGRALTGLALGLTVSGDRLALAGKGLVEAEQYRLMKSHLAASGPPPGFGGLVDRDAVLLLRGAFQPQLAFRLLRSYLPAAERDAVEQQLGLLRSAGVDLEGELLAALSGNMAFAFHGLDLSAGLAKLLSRPENLSPALLDTATYLQLADAQKASVLLDHARTMLQAAGLTMQAEQRGKLELSSVLQGPTLLASWLRHGDMLVVTTGAQRIERVAEVLQRGGGSGSLLSHVQEPQARRAVGGDGQLGIFLSVENLMRSLPIIALAVPRAAATLGSLGALALDARIDPDGIRGELVLTFQPPPPPPAAPPAKVP